MKRLQQVTERGFSVRGGDGNLNYGSFIQLCWIKQIHTLVEFELIILQRWRTFVNELTNIWWKKKRLPAPTLNSFQSSLLLNATSVHAQSQALIQIITFGEIMWSCCDAKMKHCSERQWWKCFWVFKGKTVWVSNIYFMFLCLIDWILFVKSSSFI